MASSDDETVRKALNDILPKSLDDVIRKNRDQYELRCAQSEDLLALEAPIAADRCPDFVLNYWYLIDLFRKPISTSDSERDGASTILLLGDESNGNARLTSTVQILDLNRQRLLTKSRTLYGLGIPGKGDIPQHQLMSICATFNYWGFGKVLGVPDFFY